MRELFDDIAKNQPLDPTEAARRHARPRLMQRLYKDVGVAKGEGTFAVRLDGRPVRTPARRVLAAPTAALAEALAQEWRSQGEQIDPATMPLTRLANTIIDGVADAPEPVATEIENYLASDLLFYRADGPATLVQRQAASWDPLIDWARSALGARFVLAQGLIHVPQPPEAIAAARAVMPADLANPKEVWRLGALNAITTLTGSALIALALLRRQITVDKAWAAAHVDEEWNMEQWGRDILALERRAYRFGEMQAAATVLTMLDD